MKRILLLAVFSSLLSCNSNPIELVLKSDPYLKEIIKDKEDYEIQVMLTKINHDNTKIDFQNYQYQHDENQYFYPASTIKLPIVVLTLKKINELRSKGSDITLKSKIILNNVDNYSNFKLQKSCLNKNTSPEQGLEPWTVRVKA